MTRQKAISSLSIAAIALLTVAVPTFAQVQAAEAQSSVLIQAGAETAVSSTELIATTKVRGARYATFEFERTRFNASASTVKQPKLSASDFEARDNGFTTGTSSHFVSQPMTVSYFVPTDPTAKKQFRSDDTGSKGRKLVTFVPSRGQKLPL